MRLQLTCGVALISAATVLLMTQAAWAQPVASADLRGAIYEDSDATTITTATAAVRATAFEVVNLKARYLIDVVSSASVDVVSAATGRFDEIRHEAEGGIGYVDSSRSATVTYIRSTEPDWTSHTMSLGLSHDFFSHQLTLGVSGTLVLNKVGRVDDDNFADTLTVGAGGLSATIVASPKDIVSVAYSATYSAGYHASPYRFAYLLDHDPSGLTAGLTLSAPETHPEKRFRQALAARYNRYLFKHSALRSHLRGYLDDWGIRSVTFGSEYVIGFPPVELGVFVRGYGQTKATFYQPTYATPQRYMSADREMCKFMDGFAGARIGWRHRFKRSFIDTLRAEARGQVLGFRYYGYPRLKTRGGGIGELGLGATF